MTNLPVLMTEYNFFVIDRKNESFILDEPEHRKVELPVEDIIRRERTILIHGRVFYRQDLISIGKVTRVDYKCEEHEWA